MTTSARDRARQLIALATGPTTPAEEARNAAMAAVRLIARERLVEERGIFDVQPAKHCRGCQCFSNDFGRGKAPSPRRQPPPSSPSEREVHDFWRDTFREPESAEQRRYREGWERTFGRGCSCTFVVLDERTGRRSHQPGCPRA
jgi:hypothetical protein